jgi:hypothetical protein
MSLMVLPMALQHIRRGFTTVFRAGRASLDQADALKHVLPYLEVLPIKSNRGCYRQGFSLDGLTNKRMLYAARDPQATRSLHGGLEL